MLGKQLQRSPRVRRCAAWLAAGLLAVGLLAAAHAPLLRATAAALIVVDPLERADVIVILGGGVPFREMEAAQLYRDGWAPKLMLVREAQQERQLLLAQIGVPWDEWVLRSRVLERLGVPPSALTIPDGEAFGTLEELQAVMAALPQEGGTAILVTSLQHTRRAGTVWRSVAPPQWSVIVHSAPQDPFDPDLWWRDRRFALSVAQEYLGLFNMWLGSPVAGRPTAAGAGAGR